MIGFTNPRHHAEITNWPIGGSRRGTAVFTVEHNVSRGVRVSRTTTGKPKFTTYCHAAAIVDGANGQTYILTMSAPEYGAGITVRSSDMQHDARTDEIDGPHYITRAMPEYAELAALIAAATGRSVAQTPGNP